MTTHMIELKKVSKFYSGKDTVSTGFSKVDLALDIGEFVAITGESGSGKSTLLNVISGLDSYEEGELFVNGNDTQGYRNEDYEEYRKQYIGNIFQDFNLVGSYSVYQNIELSLLLLGKKKGEDKEKIKELIELVGLTKYTKSKVSKLSGGQKQRVAIARALAKDAPIIVADEPTGNLDSESAQIVMDVLGKISKDRLVIVVTHNYEQVESLVTRKLTMSDGKLIEDKKIKRADADISSGEDYDKYEVEAEELFSYVSGKENKTEEVKTTDKTTGSKNKKYGKLTFGSQLRLGIRNTFNLATKFILLLIIFLFITTAVLAQYASVAQTMHKSDLLGYNQYFQDRNPGRIVLKKKDKSVFTDEDIAKIKKIENVKDIVKNDAALDGKFTLEGGEGYCEGPAYPIDILKKKLTSGRMPENANEIVLYADKTAACYHYLKANKDNVLGKSFELYDTNQFTGERIDPVYPGKVKVVGVVLDTEVTDSVNLDGSGKIFVTDEVANSILMKNVSNNSEEIISYGNKKVKNNGEQLILTSTKVDPGNIWISEDSANTYMDENARGKKMDISIKNLYFEDSRKFNITNIIKESNAKELIGVSKEGFSDYANKVFINPKDFNAMFDKGTYQISILLKDELKSKDVVSRLNTMGLDYIIIKDSLTDITGGFSFVIKLWQGATTIISFVVIFFIAYAVIRLIMRSRNSYYSLLRILGANKRSTDNILKIELVSVMMIAYMMILGVVMAVHKGLIDAGIIMNWYNMLKVTDYIILAVILFVMCLLIANRYSRKIFQKSAMTVYREEA